MLVKKKKKEAEKKAESKKNVRASKDSTEKEEIKEPGIHELKAMVEAEKDRALRLSAEFENYKKRSLKETQDFRRFANETLLKQLLSVVDNLERAIDTSEESSENKSLLDGIKMTHKEMMRIFEAFEVKPLKAEGEIFDPNFHQAVTQEESDSCPANTIIKELQKGYTLHSRLLRPSMVIVSKKPEEKKVKEEEKENTN
ncbi:MAG: nucleotide exchange factor GrpE [Desulfobacteraceae bacterium]|nr:nucleotide exchange factor GrpE [Desulfobacteraceae bacterium]